MNSGWVYLASLATSSCEGKPDALPLISWNSRCSSSLISRLDFLLVEAGIDKLGDRFPHIGTVPGWGGTRPRTYSLNWPSGYRSWPTVFEAGKLVQKIVHFLNTETDKSGKLKYRQMPLAGGETVPWTSRGVQLVLFFDGY